MNKKNEYKYFEISNLYRNIAYIKKLKKIIDKTKNDNPPIIIEKINIKKNNGDIIDLNIIQEGYLIAGTKQRAIVPYIKSIIKKNKNIKRILYNGTFDSFGPVALAYAGYRLGIKIILYITFKLADLKLNNEITKNYNSIVDKRQLNTLYALNSTIFLCDSFHSARYYQYLEAYTNFPNKNHKPNINYYKKYTIKDDYYVPTIGLYDELFIKILTKKIKQAIKKSLLMKTENPIIWLVASSGSILRALHSCIPNATFNILLFSGGTTKKRIESWISLQNNINILDVRTNFTESKRYINERKLYYSSVAGYDDLIWPYLKEYAGQNHFIWNVCSDDYLPFFP
jgi:hypothetical protein